MAAWLSYQTRRPGRSSTEVGVVNLDHVVKIYCEDGSAAADGDNDGYLWVRLDLVNPTDTSDGLAAIAIPAGSGERVLTALADTIVQSQSRNGSVVISLSRDGNIHVSGQEPA